MLAFFQPTAPPLGRAATYKGYSKETFYAILQCDWIGAAICMAWACCAILALQWGGITRPWNDGGVITCLVLTAVIPPLFFGWEYWLGEKAMFKMKLMRRRTIKYVSFLLYDPTHECAISS